MQRYALQLVDGQIQSKFYLVGPKSAKAAIWAFYEVPNPGLHDILLKPHQ